MQAFEIQISENIQNSAVCTRRTAQLQYESPHPTHKKY